MKNTCKIIILILATTILLSAQTWNHILSDYSIIDIEVYNGGYWVATESDGAFRYDNSESINGTVTIKIMGSCQKTIILMI